MLDYELLLRPLAALLAGALVGLERSYHGRAAGLRTYALVCLGSALLVALAEELTRGPAGGLGDSTRVIQGIVTGIGFLGAGVIVKEGFSVRGLTYLRPSGYLGRRRRYRRWILRSAPSPPP